MAAAFGVLGGVRQQVDQHLFQASGVGEHPNRVWWQSHCEFLSALFDQRANGFDSAFSDLAHGNAFKPQLDSAGCDARHLQQVIDKMLKLPHLTFDDPTSLLLSSILRGLLQTQKLDCIGDRSQRTTQLVAEHRQKFVLATMEIGKL